MSGYNFGAWYLAKRARIPQRLRSQSFGAEAEPLLDFVAESSKAATWLVFRTGALSLVITGGVLIRNAYTLPLLYADYTPAWLPVLQLAIYIAFYGLFFLPATFLMVYVWGIRKLTTRER